MTIDPFLESGVLEVLPGLMGSQWSLPENDVKTGSNFTVFPDSGVGIRWIRTTSYYGSSHHGLNR